MTMPGTRGTAARRLATRGRTVTRARAGPRVTTGFGRRTVPASDRRADFLAGFATADFGFAVFSFAVFGFFAAFFARDLAAGLLPAALVAFLRAALAPVLLAAFFAPRFAVDFVFLRLGRVTIRTAVSTLRTEWSIFNRAGRSWFRRGGSSF